MTSKLTFVAASVLMFAFLIQKYEVEARYLPTRSNGDRIDKLRELLKDVSNFSSIPELRFRIRDSNPRKFLRK